MKSRCCPLDCHMFLPCCMLQWVMQIDLRLSYGLCCHMLQQVMQIDADLKAKAQAYNSLKGNLQNLERKSVSVFLCWHSCVLFHFKLTHDCYLCWLEPRFANRGSLLSRNLADIVTKEDFVLDSEYLVTLLVVVPRYVIIICSHSKVHHYHL